MKKRKPKTNLGYGKRHYITDSLLKSKSNVNNADSLKSNIIKRIKGEYVAYPNDNITVILNINVDYKDLIKENK